VEPNFSLNPLSDLDQMFAYPFMVNAFAAGTIVAAAAALVGWFMVLRRESFVGHTLSVMSFPGAGLALLVGAPLMVGYFAFCVAGALVISASTRTRGGRSIAQESAVIGTVQASGFALGFLFLSLHKGVLTGLESLLFGSFLGITRDQVLVLAVVASATAGFFAIAGRPLIFASVDERVARAAGVRVNLLSICFLLVLGLGVAATAQITGVLLVFALLVAPAAAAQQLTARVGLGLLLSFVIGVSVVWIGLTLSYFTNYSVGFFITTLAFATFVAARLLRGSSAVFESRFITARTADV
jgi:zinc/manganese transport system permease protein